MAYFFHWFQFHSILKCAVETLISLKIIVQISKDHAQRRRFSGASGQIDTRRSNGFKLGKIQVEYQEKFLLKKWPGIGTG